MTQALKVTTAALSGGPICSDDPAKSERAKAAAVAALFGALNAVYTRLV